ncbi:hypothetical protein PIB30_046100 [Stylosanthes scabra]|uniref:pectinesterase n=1 Tax=Stylosanthes scabra TaxID=79078 RepID=A0ABU6XGK1_9FABA|nr:hypothetical protein [Stylosanthes scabra]
MMTSSYNKKRILLLLLLLAIMVMVINGDDIGSRNMISWDDLLVDEESLSYNNDGQVFVVDQAGNGDSTTVQGAVDMVQQNNPQRVKIYIYPGIYRERVHVPKNKPYISFIGKPMMMMNATEIGSGILLPVITNSTKASDKGSWEGKELGMSNTATLWVQSDFFCATAITIEECILYSVAEDWGAIAAHHRNSAEEDTGFSFVNCRIKGNGGRMLLGRAWGEYSRTVYSFCEMDDIIDPIGWSDWHVPSRQQTAVFGEYQCYGKGSNRTGRVEWSKELSNEEAVPFLGTNYINGDQWLRLQ